MYSYSFITDGIFSYIVLSIRMYSWNISIDAKFEICLGRDIREQHQLSDVISSVLNSLSNRVIYSYSLRSIIQKSPKNACARSS